MGRELVFKKHGRVWVRTRQKEKRNENQQQSVDAHNKVMRRFQKLSNKLLLSIFQTKTEVKECPTIPTPDTLFSRILQKEMRKKGQS